MQRVVVSRTRLWPASGRLCAARDEWLANIIYPRKRGTDPVKPAQLTRGFGKVQVKRKPRVVDQVTKFKQARQIWKQK